MQQLLFMCPWPALAVKGMGDVVLEFENFTTWSKIRFLLENET